MVTETLRLRMGTRCPPGATVTVQHYAGLVTSSPVSTCAGATMGQFLRCVAGLPVRIVTTIHGPVYHRR